MNGAVLPTARPPLLARSLLRLAVPAAHREFVTGDLNETFNELAGRIGARRARRWFWREALIAACTRWPRAASPVQAPPTGDSPVQTLFQDLRFGVRLLRRSPGFAAVAILMLGLGIGANTTIFGWVNSVLLTPIPGAADQGRLVSIGQTFRGQTITLSYPDYVEYRDQSRLLSGIAGRDDQAVHLTVDGVPERVWSEIVTGNFFDVLGVPAALGRTFLPEEDRTPGAAAVAVISHGLWQRRFGGDPAVVNREVEINKHPFTIVGVAPPGFQGSQTAIAYDIWIPMMMQPTLMPGGDRLSSRGNHWMTVFGRLAPGATVAQVREELEAITRRIAEQVPDYKGFGASAGYLRDSSDGAIGVLRPVLLALAVVAALVLLIACANLANLMIVRSAVRRREIAIRLSIGASRRRVVRQLLTESLLIAAGGAVLALIIARLTAGMLVLFAPPTEFTIAIDVPLDGRVFAFTTIAALVTAVLFGLMPAVQASSSDYTTALKEGTPGAGASRRRLRDALVVAEVSLSLALLMSAGLCVRSMQKAQEFDPGFNPSGVLLASLDLFPAGYTTDTGRVFFDQLLERLRALPGVEAVTLSRRVPLGFSGSSSSSVQVEGYAPAQGESMSVALNQVGPDYLRTMQIPLAQGRDLAPTDGRDAPAVAVINETMAKRFWTGRDPIGGRFRFGATGTWFTVVGVAREVKFNTLTERPRPFAYLPVLQAYYPAVAIHVRTTGDPGTLAPAVREAVRALDPSLPVYSTRTLAAHTGAATFQQRMAGSLLSVFGGLALVLAVVGLYGVVAFVVGQRTREIGVRMALGAPPSAVFGQVLRYGLKLTVIGAAIGLGVAFGVAQALKALLFGVEAYDPLTLAVATVVLGASAGAACLVPALRAMRVDPVRALRYE
jgi:predicted permease